MILRPYQEQNLNEILACLQRGVKGTVYVCPTGGGKCLGKGTPVLMYDGKIKNVEDIKQGDQLMGPDSKPRLVVSTCRGTEPLYRVSPKRGGDPFIVNESHILSFKRTRLYSNPDRPYHRLTGHVFNVSVREYLAKSKYWKHIHKAWRSPVDFEPHREPLRLDAYFMGLWLGDGDSDKPRITTGSSEVIIWLTSYAKNIGVKAVTKPNSERSIRLLFLEKNQTSGFGSNRVVNALRAYNVLRNKHVPHRYKTGTREERYNLLAGILDSDGYWSGKGYDLTLKNEQLLDDVIFVARSLGFSAFKRRSSKKCTNTGAVGTYYQCHINGPVDQIPCRIESKKAPPRSQKKDPLLSGISVDPIGDGEYFGFELDGPDRLFLLGDFTVTHNTAVAVNVIRTVVNNGWEAAFFVHRRELLRQASTTLKRHGIPHGLIAPGHDLTDHPVHVASVDTFRSRFKRLELWLKTIKLVVVDEAHHAPAGGFKRILQSMASDACALGLTATPFRLDGKGLREFFSEQVKAPTIADLISDGFLSPPHVHQPPIKISTAGIATRGGDFVQSDLAKRMDDDELTRATVANYARYAAGVPTIAFCAGVDHAKHVAERFSEAGWRAESVDGTLSTGERDRRIKALGTGELQILTSCDIISEGTDVPIVGGAILLRPTKSTCLYIQQIGRVLRPYPGKDAAIVIDMVGNVKTHGMPDANRVWSLHDGIDKSQREKIVERTRRCPKRGCWRVHEWAEKCPGCGYVYPANPLNNRAPGAPIYMPKNGLMGFTAEQIQAAKLSDLMRLKPNEQELKVIARVKGYKPGWVWFQLKQREEMKQRFRSRWR